MKNLTDKREIPKEQLVCESKCDQCLFSKNRIVSKKRMVEILEDTLKQNTHFICHKGTINNQNIVCAGFYDRYDSTWLKLAKAMGIIKIIKP